MDPVDLSNNDEAPLTVRMLGLQDYEPTWQAMRDYTHQRANHPDGASDGDELWVLQHPPTFTLGQAGKAEHLLAPGDIPVINVDRGGQVTYHGPGQLVVYVLVNLERKNLGAQALVRRLEQALIGLLAEYGLESEARQDAPGVYIDNKKIASLGLRIRKGFSYHGLSLNIDMDLEPFQRINPCGYAGMQMTSLKALDIATPLDKVSRRLIERLCAQLRYNEVSTTCEPISVSH